jgi:hypothetical protein
VSVYWKTLNQIRPCFTNLDQLQNIFLTYTNQHAKFVPFGFECHLRCIEAVPAEDRTWIAGVPTHPSDHLAQIPAGHNKSSLLTFDARSSQVGNNLFLKQHGFFCAYMTLIQLI